jgi:hypothetical protein
MLKIIWKFGCNLVDLRMKIITTNFDCQNTLSLIEKNQFRCREVVIGVSDQISFYWDGYQLVDVGDGGFDILNRYKYEK